MVSKRFFFLETATCIYIQGRSHMIKQCLNSTYFLRIYFKGVYIIWCDTDGILDVLSLVYSVIHKMLTNSKHTQFVISPFLFHKFKSKNYFVNNVSKFAVAFWDSVTRKFRIKMLSYIELHSNTADSQSGAKLENPCSLTRIQAFILFSNPDPRLQYENQLSNLPDAPSDQ